eukprot:2799529-Karenia_brevis.AAC.1
MALASEAEGALGGGVDALLRALDIAPVVLTSTQTRAITCQGEEGAGGQIQNLRAPARNPRATADKPRNGIYR